MSGCRRAGTRRAALARAFSVLASLSILLASPPAKGTSPEGVAATIPPLADIVRQVSGDTASVISILPPGGSPHTFDPRPGAVRELSRAGAIFAIGHGLDDWVSALASAAGATRIVRADAGVPLRRVRASSASGGSVEGLLDPHYWLSCANAKRIAQTVEEQLASLFPDRADGLRVRRENFAARLDALDGEIRAMLAGLPSRDLATFHDSFEYFAADYGLRVVAVFEPFPGREPGPRFVQEFQKRIRQTRVRTVFGEPQLSLDVLRPIAGDLGVTLSVLDPLGGVPGRETFIELMRFNAQQIARSAAGEK